MEYQGISGSNGIAIGKAYIYRQEEFIIDKEPITVDCITKEKDKLKLAVDLTKLQIEIIKDKALTEVGEKEAQVFAAHLEIVSDPTLIEEIEELISSNRYAAAYAAEQVIAQYVSLFSNMEDEYMRERSADIRDVGERLIRNVLGIAPKRLDHLSGENIIIAEDLTPSDTMTIDRRHVKGFIVNAGGKTSHAAILARTLEIPAVMGLKNSTNNIKDGQLVIVDGSTGKVIVNPSLDLLAEYKEKLAQYVTRQEELKKLISIPAQTTDGKLVTLMANIGTPQDADIAIEKGAQGIGLYRTEFLYMEHAQLPSEDEQYEAYKIVAEKFMGKPVIIRTLDIGGDKSAKCFTLPKETNPFLGWRAIRISLSRPDIFKTQLRAILRASAFGQIWIMFPMISGISEVREAKVILEQSKQELRDEGIRFDENLKIGIMVEIPSAAVTADIISKEVDFFSIGTNDLCQYTLAVDRINENISHLYQPLHPAVLRLIKQVIEVSNKHGKVTGLCGEMAGDPLAIIVLLGLGLEKFSTNAATMLTVKEIIRAVSYEKAKEVADVVMTMDTPEEIMQYSAQVLKDLGLN
ncbi:phosphoenolpyruvate--protein phosphotransferase [Dendrosporobacter sp. 1207_IL3150]|uniref:phosphoenolpyruvate--protein phosphotransferase n=1 Tax=Dendrosporobacter sp. 1207_IL3150 TaxID=3084054 RepID=UPI002FDA48A8